MRTIGSTINLALLVLLAVTVLASDVHGQQSDLEKLRQYIEQNQALLLEAEILVRGTNSAKARASLDAARQLHMASMKELEGDRALASAHTAQLARNAILKAIQLAKRETKLEEQAFKSIDYAQRRNEHARTLLDESESDEQVPARKLIDESMDRLLRARGSMREHMFEVAIQSANASIDMSNRAIRILKRDTVGPELVRREIARTDLLLERVDELGDRGGGNELTRMIGEAHDLQTRARANVAEGRYILAFENTRRARAIARRILNRAGGSTESTAEAVARAIELTDELIDQAYENASGEQVRRRLDEAARLQQNAHDAYAAGQHDRAFSFTQRARDITRKAMRDTDHTIDAESARRALERTDEIIARLRTELEGGGSGDAAQLHERAASRQATAWEAFNSGELNKALANTKVARNLASRALQLLKNG